MNKLVKLRGERSSQTQGGNREPQASESRCSDRAGNKLGCGNTGVLLAYVVRSVSLITCIGPFNYETHRASKRAL
jgi:hypothetical protein